MTLYCEGSGEPFIFFGGGGVGVVAPTEASHIVDMKVRGEKGSTFCFGFRSEFEKAE
jgi:hypothetical protein